VTAAQTNLHRSSSAFIRVHRRPKFLRRYRIELDGARREGNRIVFENSRWIAMLTAGQIMLPRKSPFSETMSK
jgi:hypothetical protein